MTQRDYHRPNWMGTAVGVDVGATLAKLSFLSQEATPRFTLIPAHPIDRVAELVAQAQPQRIGVTGGGAASLAQRLGMHCESVNEFRAWGAGAAALLRTHRLEAGPRYLLVSLGTGTSILLVENGNVTRVGGTALGGGTLAGLSALLFETRSFSELTRLAARGKRQSVDLLVSDIYAAGELPLPGDLTASNFGKLWRMNESPPRPAPEDIAQALMGLVGENVALICGGLAATCGTRRIVFAGSTLRENGCLTDVLHQVTKALRCEPLFLPDGEFAGSLGALLLAANP